MQPDTSTNQEAPKVAVPSAQQDFVSKLEAQGREWDAQLGLWGAKADKASTALKADFHKWQREFQEKRAAAHGKIETLKTAKHEAWEEVKTGVETAWNDVKSTFENAKKKFE